MKTNLDRRLEACLLDFRERREVISRHAACGGAAAETVLSFQRAAFYLAELVSEEVFPMRGRRHRNGATS